MKKTIKALIPVRSGSVRVKNKNIRPFADSNLLAIKIKQLLSIKELDGVVVNSNSDEMLDIAKNLGAEAVKRNEYFATSEVSINEVYKNIAENFDADVMVYSNCTSPMISNETIIQCINIFKNLDNEYDSVNTANLIKEFLWLDGKTINYDASNMPRSQDLPKIIAPNFAVNIINTNLLIQRKNVCGYKPYFYITNKVEGIDIDDEIDFDFAEFMYRKNILHNIK